MVLQKQPITEVYHIHETLGSGSFAVVKRGTRISTGKEVAIKIIDRKVVGEQAAKSLKTEISILQQIRHPNVIALEEIFDNGNKLYLVTELVTGGELFDRIVAKGHFNEPQAAEITWKILDATQYLHSVGIVHRDLKPENLLLSDPSDTAEVKVADFGLAKILGGEGQMMFTTCGTPGYVAPEVLKNKGYDRQVDVWSVGVILYILLCGFPPFYEENTALLFEQIMRGQYDFPEPYWDSISAQAKDLVQHLLVVDPKKRYTTQQCLQHAWFKKFRTKK